MMLWHEVSYDEHFYISAGLQYVEGKFLANYEHPPLVKYMLGIYLKTLYPSAQQDYGNVNISDYKLLMLSRLFTVFFGALTIIPLFLLAEKIIGFNYAVIAALFLALNPAHARISGITYLDAPMMFFGVSAILWTLNFLEKPTWKNMLITGVCNGLLISTRWIMPFIFIIPIILFMTVFYRKRKILALYMLSLSIAVLVLFALWIPQLYLLNFRILDFIGMINQHWKPQFGIVERDFIQLILYNMTIAELTVYSLCFIVNLVAILKMGKYGEPYSVFPVLFTTVIGTLIFIEIRKAAYYLVPIVPFLALLSAQTLHLISQFRKTQNTQKHFKSNFRNFNPATVFMSPFNRDFPNNKSTS